MADPVTLKFADNDTVFSSAQL